MARRKKGNIVNGWLVIDKPQNMGSTDVVNKTRYWYQAQKNGHTGTLDPFATGVLPIAFGEATKIIPFVTDGEKEYEFVIQWGEETDTDDELDVFFEETRFEAKPSLWERVKNCKFVRTMKYIMKIRVVLDYPALPEGRGE